MLLSIGIEKSTTILKLYNYLHTLLLVFYLPAFYYFMGACVWLSEFNKNQMGILFWIIMLILFVSTHDHHSYCGHHGGQLFECQANPKSNIVPIL